MRIGGKKKSGRFVGAADDISEKLTKCRMLQQKKFEQTGPTE